MQTIDFEDFQNPPPPKLEQKQKQTNRKKRTAIGSQALDLWVLFPDSSSHLATNLSCRVVPLKYFAYMELYKMWLLSTTYFYLAQCFQGLLIS